MKKLKWSTDSSDESLLKKSGIRYARVTLNLGDIDADASFNNNSRLSVGARDNAELKEDYALAMAAGDKFPPLVVWKDSTTGLYVVASGNQRLGAVLWLVDVGECSKTNVQIEAFEMKTTNRKKIDLFTRTANRLNGGRQDRCETVQQALQMHHKYNMDIEELADHFNIEKENLRNAMHAEEMRDKITNEFLIDASGMKASTLIKLKQLGYSDRVQRKASAIAAKHKLLVRETQQMVDAAKGTKSERAAIETLDKWNERQHTIGRKDKAVSIRSRTNWGRFTAPLRTLLNLLESGNRGKQFESLDSLGGSEPAEIIATRTEWRAVKRKVDRLFKNVKE